MIYKSLHRKLKSEKQNATNKKKQTKNKNKKKSGSELKNSLYSVNTFQKTLTTYIPSMN